MKFNKPPLTIDEQITLLESRNLLIEDKAKARIALENISYYRLSSYLYPFRINKGEDQNFVPFKTMGFPDDLETENLWGSK